MDGQLDTSSPEPAGLEEHGSDPSSPATGVVDVDKAAVSSASKRSSRRAVTKRVVTVPIADIEGSTRLKGEGGPPPPPDSWSWRKYGQKPIKGSPYPRGYYRCSSSKGCPARKQVERNRANPTMLVVTYASDHNHSWPSARSSPSTVTTVATSSAVASPPSPASPKLPAASLASPSVTEDDDKFDALLPDEFGWFSDIAAVPQGESTLHSPIWAAGAAEGGVVCQMGAEEESLFADLGELPECSVVFRRVEDGRRLGLAAAAPWCGSTG